MKRYGWAYNEQLKDDSLSPKARLLLCWIQGHSDNFVFYVDNICAFFKWPNRSVRRLISELVSAGYLENQLPSKGYKLCQKWHKVMPNLAQGYAKSGQAHIYKNNNLEKQSNRGTNDSESTSQNLDDSQLRTVESAALNEYILYKINAGVKWNNSSIKKLLDRWSHKPEATIQEAVDFCIENQREYLTAKPTYKKSGKQSFEEFLEEGAKWASEEDTLDDDFKILTIDEFNEQ